ncbi:PD-(D/E)XK nuclease family protein [Aliikangiella sp. G2MR2-5]|uniref:PD-(D/E)XK nuclease family protein n=1 Tax=Aliikangiella sp. G2MR2-5 TaxID=2788943 RepID=UPI0018ABD741|nr:PD-(D/E)XK nuclease family protein [Aliikangiella sp. G2MR2-5]
MPIAIDTSQVAHFFKSIESTEPESSENSLILTPNARTQSAVIAGFMKDVKQHDVTYSPNIMSIGQWRDELWRSLAFTKVLPVVINQLELKFWLKDLIAKEDNWQLTNELGVAEKVLDTFKNLTHWQISISDLPEAMTQEQRYFVQWIEQMLSYLSERKLILDCQKWPIILENLTKLERELPNKVLMIGFNEVTPVENAFLEKIQERNCSVESFYPQKNEPNVYKAICQNSSQEIEFAAAKSLEWTSAYPDESIGVVVHGLSGQVEKVHQIFSDYFQEDEIKPWSGLGKCRYNVSAGTPIAQIPKASAALKILKLKSFELSLEELRFIKNTPFIYWGEFEGTIKNFLNQLSLLALPKYRVDYLIEQINQHENVNQLKLLRARIIELKERSFITRALPAWSRSWKHCLQQWGWGTIGEACSDSNQSHFNQGIDDFSVKVESDFLDCLIDFSKLSITGIKYSHKAAFELFTQLVKQSAFQLPSDRTNVHVLGVLEAVGLEFDRVILIGFNRGNWPQKASASPFLPYDFQGMHDMPGSSAEREYRYAEQVSRSLLGIADEICITQSKTSENGEQLSSIFFESIPVKEFRLDKLIKGSVKLNTDYRWRSDCSIDIPQGTVKGGAYLLSDYAKCPFMAITRHVLKVDASEELKEGIDPRVKGTWLHRAVELFWNHTQSQSNLISLSCDELISKVEEYVNQAKVEQEHKLYAAVAPEIIEIERRKMITLISEWLEIDKQKPAFRVKTEVEKSLELAGLNFSFKIDRVDTFENQSIEIIDYKTGKVSVKKWMSERPEEAQMPAYVIACENEAQAINEQLNLSALSYARLRTGEVSRVGIVFDLKSSSEFQVFEQTVNQPFKVKKLNKEVYDTHRPLKTQWRENLERLAANIASGMAPVSPGNINETCQFCEYSSFCRIKEEQPEESITNDFMSLDVATDHSNQGTHTND